MVRHIDEIIIHTTATRPEWMAGKSTLDKVNEIGLWHTRDRGWKAIGYHLIIDRDGTIANGRPIAQIGAHTRGRNQSSIGIALIGGFGGAATDSFGDHYTPAQEKALRAEIARLQETYTQISKVTGHNQYAAKACPCFSVPDWLAPPIPPSMQVQRTLVAVIADLFKRWKK